MVKNKELKKIKRIAPLNIELYINADGSVTFADLAKEATDILKKLKGKTSLLENNVDRTY